MLFRSVSQSRYYGKTVDDALTSVTYDKYAKGKTGEDDYGDL